MNTSSTTRLLTVSCDLSLLRSLRSLCKSGNWQLQVVAGVREAIDRLLADGTTTLLLVDVPHGDRDSLQILRWIGQMRPSLPIVVIGSRADIQRNRESLSGAARGCLARPVPEDDLAAVLRRNLSAAHDVTETELRSDDVEPVGDGKFFIAMSPVMRRIRSQLAVLAEANFPVLVLGETGTGRETAARLLHKLSLRSAFHFASVNCAALPEELLARELFGYERADAAASGRTVRGKLELCGKGTLFLDHIAELPRDLQAALLEVLDTGQFLRPGSAERVRVDVRIVAAGTVNLERAARDGRFCSDLYRDLSVCQVHIPPLRERREEIPFLARHFMHRLARQFRLPPRTLSPAILDTWTARDWPGNLRELESLVKRRLYGGDDDDMASHNSLFDLQPESCDLCLAKQSNGDRPVAPAEPPAGADRPYSLRSLAKIAKSEAERTAIASALEKTGWNRKAAARMLNVSYRSVLYKIEQYRLISPAGPFQSASRKTPPGEFHTDEFDAGPGNNRPHRSAPPLQ